VKNKSTDELKKAKNYAFLLLKFRPRSEKEIYQRLKNKKFNEEIIKNTVAFLKDKEFIDDNYFAKAWIQSRIKRPLGLGRLRAELKVKGVDKEIIDSQIQEIKKDYAEEDIVKAIAKAKISKLKGIEPLKAKRRILDYLLRRGFSAEIAFDVVGQL
jgi:regulatory protein